MAYDPVFTEEVEWEPEDHVTSAKLDDVANNQQHNYDYTIHTAESPTGKIKMARGQNQIEWPGGSTTEYVDVDYEADADDGDPEFTIIPVVMVNMADPPAGGGAIAGNMIIYVDEENSDNETCRIICHFDSYTPPDGQITYFNWLAIGH